MRADVVMPGQIPKIDHPKSVSCTDVLSEKKKVGQKVAIIGAGLDDILSNDPDGEPFQTRWRLNELLDLHGVKKHMGHMLDSINDQGRVLKNKAGGPTQIEVDDVIIAIGFRTRKSISPLFQTSNHIKIGDGIPPPFFVEPILFLKAIIIHSI